MHPSIVATSWAFEAGSCLNIFEPSRCLSSLRGLRTLWRQQTSQESRRVLIQPSDNFEMSCLLVALATQNHQLNSQMAYCCELKRVTEVECRRVKIVRGVRGSICKCGYAILSLILANQQAHDAGGAGEALRVGSLNNNTEPHNAETY